MVLSHFTHNLFWNHISLQYLLGLFFVCFKHNNKTPRKYQGQNQNPYTGTMDSSFCIVWNEQKCLLILVKYLHFDWIECGFTWCCVVKSLTIWRALKRMGILHRDVKHPHLCGSLWGRLGLRLKHFYTLINLIFLSGTIAFGAVYAFGNNLNTYFKLLFKLMFARRRRVCIICLNQSIQVFLFVIISNEVGIVP